jgi:hypothetical protein
MLLGDNDAFLIALELEENDSFTIKLSAPFTEIRTT